MNAVDMMTDSSASTLNTEIRRDVSKIEKVARDFESYFVGYIFEMASRSIPKEGFLGGSSQEQMYQSMFVQQLSSEGAKSPQGFGLAQQLIRQLEGRNQMAQMTESGLGADLSSRIDHEVGESLLIPQGRVTSGYGMRPDPFTGEQKFHEGIDFAFEYGSPIHAAGDGEVMFSGESKGYGKMLILRHPDGVETLYGHNSDNLVKVGDKVKAGDIIGRTGDTGRSTGPHLHFEIRREGRPVNPGNYYMVAKKI